MMLVLSIVRWKNKVFLQARNAIRRTERAQITATAILRNFFLLPPLTALLFLIAVVSIYASFIRIFSEL
jgi:hypothetical protein